MSLHRIGAIAVALGLASSPALAADPAADPAAVQTPIKGTDVMGDKGRSGPDGWSWAPQTRDQVATDRHEAAGRPGDLNSQPGSGAGKTLAAGEDPGTPAATDAHGPGSIDSGNATRP